MTITCPIENKSHEEFSIDPFQNQTNPGETQF